MAIETTNERKRSVRWMFARLARRYDLINRVITLGRDRHWRKETVDRLELDGNEHLLDLGTGTGGLAFEILRRAQKSKIVGVDFTPQMIRLAKRRDHDSAVAWIIADAGQLPFAADAFDGVVSAFVLRNLVDLDRSLQEQNRILKREGRIVCLETSPPTRNAYGRLVGFYMRHVLPLLGGLISGDGRAYHYLERSTATFLSTENLAQRMRAAKFVAVHFVRFMFGNVAIHWAKKSGE